MFFFTECNIKSQFCNPLKCRLKAQENIFYKRKYFLHKMQFTNFTPILKACGSYYILIIFIHISVCKLQVDIALIFYAQPQQIPFLIFHFLSLFLSSSSHWFSQYSLWQALLWHYTKQKEQTSSNLPEQDLLQTYPLQDKVSLAFIFKSICLRSLQDIIYATVHSYL